MPVIFLPFEYRVHKSVLLSLVHFEPSPDVRYESLKPVYLFPFCFLSYDPQFNQGCFR